MLEIWSLVGSLSKQSLLFLLCKWESIDNNPPGSNSQLNPAEDKVRLRTVNFHTYLSPLKHVSPFTCLQGNPSVSYFVLPGRDNCSPVATPGLQLGFDSSEPGELKTNMSLCWWAVPRAQHSLWKGDDPVLPSSKSLMVTCLQPQKKLPFNYILTRCVSSDTE